MASEYPLLSVPGVLLRMTEEPTWIAIRKASQDFDSNKVTVVHQNGEAEVLDTEGITNVVSTDTIEFESGGIKHIIRHLREPDGVWLSDYKTDVPVDALESIIIGGDSTVDENMTAYVMDDSPYVIGLVYSVDGRRYVRLGEWVLLSPDDNSFGADNILSVDINPEMAKAFVKLYDKNYVSVADLSEYESVDSGLPELF